MCEALRSKMKRLLLSRITIFGLLFLAALVLMVKEAYAAAPAVETFSVAGTNGNSTLINVLKPSGRSSTTCWSPLCPPTPSRVAVRRSRLRY
ncbi:hypothetical protein MYX65_01500 [Acidobacteria bacterium AH-259-L09]|nr:hypothetical protein [Acidobacteria bacterium AH-259-L09]